MTKSVAVGNSRYLDQMVRLHCAPDLIALKLFPNAKEVTESFAAYNAMLDHLSSGGLRPGEEEITGIFPGDGQTPRTGATFAFRTAWECISIDPRMSPSWVTGRRKVDRLVARRLRMEEMSVLCRTFAVVVAVHSHAPLPAAVRAALNAEEVAIVAIPCCKQQALAIPPDIRYRDDGILSPCNEVLVWRPRPAEAFVSMTE